MINEIEKKLTEAGYIITKTRLKIIELLLSLQQPISVESLDKKIKEVDRASIYRTLNLLFKLDLLNKEIIHRKAVYCLSIIPHHHIICRKCGRVENISCQHKFENIKNFKKIRHQLSLTGICSKCS